MAIPGKEVRCLRGQFGTYAPPNNDFVTIIISGGGGDVCCGHIEFVTIDKITEGWEGKMGETDRQRERRGRGGDDAKL